jgi:hypothetical protein
MAATLQLGSSTITLNATKPRIYAGRDATACGLAFLDPGLSRRHAEVWLENGQTYIRDLGSSNGTWVNGQMVGHHPVQLAPGQNVFLGTVPLGIAWEPELGGGATMMVQMPEELRRMVEMRKQAAAAGGAMPAAPMAPSPAAMGPMNPMMAMPQPAMQGMMQSPQNALANSLGVGGHAAPIPSDLAYRRQGSNNNGVLLIALPGDTFSNANTINGYIEFTSTDAENVASISVELVEFHKKGPGDGHIWDRVLVRQGPWKTRSGDVLPLPFQLRVPPGTSISGREVIWEIRGLVDINWAVDIDCVVPITMRNTDIEKIRDALGGLDYRIVDLESAPLGQRFEGKFAPPANLRSQWGINDIDIAVEYLGANLQVRMHIDKKGIFKRDRDVDQVYDLERLRRAPIAELSQFLKQQIDQVMQQ